jgi:hypothetical protein
MKEDHEKNKDDMSNHIAVALAHALREVFGEGVEMQRFVDVTRIPLICKSIVNLENDVKSIKDNITWGVRIVLGAVILGILTLLFTTH